MNDYNRVIPARRNDLDWLRVLAVLLLVPFHAALIFVMDPNSIMYIKDTVQSDFLDQAASFVHQWHMPLLFAISGASSGFALRLRSKRQYLRERFTRLLIPFLFGLVALIPFTTYIRLIGKPGAGPYLQHFIHFFTINPDDLAGYNGTFTPGHLWFALFLFVFSLVGLPIFTGLAGQAGQRLIKWLVNFSLKPGALFLWSVPFSLVAALDLLGDKNPLYYFLVFLSGFLLVADDRLQDAIDRQTGLFIGAGIVAFAFHLLLPSYRFAEWTPVWVLLGLLENLGRWSWLLAFLGLGHRFLNRDGKVLRYLSEAAYPFYILHLPLTTLAGFVFIRLDTQVAVKYLLIVMTATLVTLAVYEVAVRRFNPMRFLFGLKPRSNRAALVKESAAQQLQRKAAKVR